MKNRKRRTGFTRTELMVVGGCLTLFIFIILPGLTGAREAGKRAICLSNLKTLGAGMLQYAQDYEGKIPCWGWQFDECGRFGPVTGITYSEPTIEQLTKFVEWGYIWEYIQSRRPFLCPALHMDKHNPRIKPSYNGWPVWGWPDWDNPTKPAPIWNYCVNAQAGMSMNDSQWRVNPELVLPSPKTVMILFEEDSSDHSAFDNACELFAPTLTVDSSLGAYHIDEGNMIFFDGHVGSMRRSEFIIKCSTPNGTLELCGGYLGFTWPGF